MLTFSKNPFHAAFGSSAVALLFIVPALLGCDLHKSDAILVAGTPTDRVL